MTELTQLKDITAERELEFQLTVEGFEGAPDAMLIVDVDGVIQIVNEAAEFLLGYHRIELKGQPVEMLVPLEFRVNHVSLRKTFWRDPIPRQMGNRILSVLHKDGYTKNVIIMLKGRNLPRGRFTIVALREIKGGTDESRSKT